MSLSPEEAAILLKTRTKVTTRGYEHLGGCIEEIYLCKSGWRVLISVHPGVGLRWPLEETTAWKSSYGKTR